MLLLNAEAVATFSHCLVRLVTATAAEKPEQIYGIKYDDRMRDEA